MDSKNNDSSKPPAAKGGGKQRTIQVKIGNASPKSMTPDQAAEYLQQLAGRGAFNGGREVKMTFGKGPPPPPSAKPPVARAAAKAITHNTPMVVASGNSTTSATAASISTSAHSPLSSMELAALAGDFGVAPSSSKSRSGGSSSKTNKDGMPCSEKEMKALMSMFVEIMGLQMNTDKLSKPRTLPSSLANKAPDALFRFPADLPPPPGGWPEDLLWPAEDEEDEDSLPDLEDCVSTNSNGKSSSDKAKTVQEMAAEIEKQPAAQQTFSAATGIAVFEWEALERVAIEDALEQEERARKAAKKRETKKNRKKEKAAKEAQTKATEAAAKKRDKQIQSWRSRVAAACQSNELTKLTLLLEESPLSAKDDEKMLRPHLEFLVPNSVAKNRQLVAKTLDVRLQLAEYLRDLHLPILMTPLRNGRSALHSACFYGDATMVELIVEAVVKETEAMQKEEDDDDMSKSDKDKKEAKLKSLNLDSICQDSGWSPMHYGALSGSMHVMEVLLRHGCRYKTLTNDTHTWRTSSNKGVTPRQLAEYVLNGTYQKELETHGMALSEAKSDLFDNKSERRRYLILLGRIVERLKEVETNGYTPLDKSAILELETVAEPKLNNQDSIESGSTATRSTVGGGKKGKKKKKKESVAATTEAPKAEPKTVPQPDDSDSESERALTAATTSTAPPVVPEPKSEPEDPLVTALLGMGFAKEKIISGIEACGGIDRATADNVVMWIFQQDSGGEAVVEPNDTIRDEGDKPAAVDKVKNNKRSKNSKPSEEDKEAALKRAEEERLAAERLAAKREEQRRRNREWNKRQEKQSMMPPPTNTSRPTGPTLAPASNFVPTVNATAAAAPLFTPKSTVGMSAPTAIVSRNADDTTEISSIGPGSADFGNDDATISTIGSNLPPVTSQPPAPPGFGPSAETIPEVEPMASQGWNAQPLTGGNAQPMIPDTRRSLPPRMVPPMTTPPGIPESGPLQLQGGLSGSALSGHLGDANLQQQGTRMPQRMSAPAGFDPGNPYAYTAQTGMDASSFFAAPAPPPAAPAGFAGMAPVATAPSTYPNEPTLPTTTSQTPTLAGMGAFGLSNQQPQRGIDSSIIESISTGGGPMTLDGAGLWGDRTPSGSGSSLLGNLIQSTRNDNDSYANNNRAPGPPNWGQQGNLSGTGNQSGGGAGGSIW